MKAYLNDIDLDGQAADIKAARVVFTKRGQADYAEKITFSGWAFDLLKERLIDDPKGYLASVPFRLEKSCCGGGLVLAGAVRGDRLDWDSNGCTATATIVQEDGYTSAYRKLESALIADYLPPDSPGILAYSGRGFIGVYATIIANAALLQLLIVLSPLILSIAAVVSVFDRGAFTDARDFLVSTAAQMRDTVIAAFGQRVPAPLVRQMLSNLAAACGLGFRSPIFEAGSAYKDLSYISIQSKRHRFATEPPRPENFPVKNATQLLDDLSLVFNGAWDVYGGQLVFDRRDRLPGAGAFDIAGESLLKISFAWKADQKRAYFDLQFTTDPEEKGGQEEAALWAHIEEWNPGGNEGQKGAYEVLVPFAPYVTGYPFGGGGGGILRLVAGALNVPVVPAQLEISGEHVFVPKLVPLTQTGGAWGAADPTPMQGQALYDAFWYIENPNYSGFRGLEFDATFEASCAFIEAAPNLYEVSLPVGNATARGFVTSVEIDYHAQTARVRGEI